jgi:UDP-N-acetyl-D-mannosaminuronic acid dehydrogenase
MWGLDTNNVIHAANAGYVRGGVPRPSPGVGGYCLSKDPFIFIESARLKRYTPHLFTSARGVHDIVISMIARNVANFVSSRGTKQPKIYILGFGFKGNPPTSDMRGSPTVDLVRALHGKGIKNIHGYDPVVNAKDIRSLGVKAEKSVALGFKDADVVIVMTNHPSFRELRMRDLLKKSRPGALLFDMWSLYSKEKILRIPGTRYWSL